MQPIMCKSSKSNTFQQLTRTEPNDEPMNWSERGACDHSGATYVGHYFGPSEVRATSGETQKGHYFW